VCVPTVHLLRHGAHADVGRRLTGRGPDHGLTAEGREQVLRAAQQLTSSPPAAIYSSPRRRTRETADIVGEHFGLSVFEVPALDEIDFGEWTGRDFAQLDRDPRWYEWNAERSNARCPGGESQSEAQARALAVAFEASARHGSSPLLVTHCDIVRALVCWAERRSLDDIHSVACEPGSLTRLDLATIHAKVAA
jgi:broad specificity phosphatase PhoE